MLLPEKSLLFMVYSLLACLASCCCRLFKAPSGFIHRTRRRKKESCLLHDHQNCFVVGYHANIFIFLLFLLKSVVIISFSLFLFFCCVDKTTQDIFTHNRQLIIISNLCSKVPLITTCLNIICAIYIYCLLYTSDAADE